MHQKLEVLSTGADGKRGRNLLAFMVGKVLPPFPLFWVLNGNVVWKDKEMAVLFKWFWLMPCTGRLLAQLSFFVYP